MLAVPTAALYARLSDVRREDADPSDDAKARRSRGIERQLREARTHAEKLGVTVVEELVDDDLSAAKKKRRPDFERLMAGIAANEWDVVVLRSLDRWVRRPDELERIIEIVEKSKVTVEAIHGEIDLRTRQGRLLARLLTAVAMAEVEATVERVTDWHADRAARGLPLHGPTGYGLAKVYGAAVVVPDEAERIREAARRVLAGEALLAIARDWNEREIPSPAGRWRPQTIRRILIAPRTAGLRVYRGEVLGAARWPAILEPDEWGRVVRLLNNPSRRSGLDRGAKLLTGLASCGKCEKTLNSKIQHGVRRYFCRHCHGVTVFAEKLEEHVVADLCVVLDGPALGAAVDRSAVGADELAREIQQAEQDADELAREAGAGQVTVSEWKVMRTAIAERLARLRSQLAIAQGDATDWIGRGVDLAESWDQIPVLEQRRILAAWVVDIRVGPAIVGKNRFDGRRVKITWRA